MPGVGDGVAGVPGTGVVPGEPCPQLRNELGLSHGRSSGIDQVKWIISWTGKTLQSPEMGRRAGKFPYLGGKTRRGILACWGGSGSLASSARPRSSFTPVALLVPDQVGGPGPPFVFVLFCF